jgi:carbon storage regulator
MLVLTRRRGEAIMVGDDVKVVVLEVNGDQVRLGVEAPRAVSVHREEVFKEIQEQNTRAARPPKNPPKSPAA